MRDRVSSCSFLVPGPWREVGAVVEVLAGRGIAARPLDDAPVAPGAVRVDLVEDDDLRQAFAWRRGGPLPEELLGRIGAFGHAALIEIGRRLDQDPPRIAAVGRALRDAGGVAVRMEASGGASSWEPWLEALESGLPGHLYTSAVIIVNDDDGTLFTCGMHHFDLPDAQIATGDSATAVDWLDAFSVFQLAEQPRLASGHTFQPHSGAPRRAMERWPDHRHSPRDGRHNPFGVWRFLRGGERGLEVSELVPVIIPPLVATLVRAEQTAGRPLTPTQVENLVANSTAMTMRLEDAIALERARGYADLEPELAWDQWQIVRAKV